jgi:endonuclease IV
MSEAEAILRRFGSRIRQIHLSLVTSSSAHEPLNYESLLAYRRVARLLPKDVPIILETPVRKEQVDEEISKATELVGS